MLLLFSTACGDGNQDTVKVQFDPERTYTMKATEVASLISDSGVTRYRLNAKEWLVFGKAADPYWYFPEGIYVDSVESDSPEMTAGVQSGDIVHTLDGQEIRSMDDYSSMLQSLNRGSKVKLEIYRRNSYGTYVNVELNVIIKEK